MKHARYVMGRVELPVLNMCTHYNLVKKYPEHLVVIDTDTQQQLHLNLFIYFVVSAYQVTDDD